MSFIMGGRYYVLAADICMHHGRHSQQIQSNPPPPLNKRHCILQIFKMHISIGNGAIAFKFYTEVKYLKLHKTIVND